jgi:hypothetical protein
MLFPPGVGTREAIDEIPAFRMRRLLLPVWCV